MPRILLAASLLFALLAACADASAPGTATPASTPTATLSSTPTSTRTPSPTPSPEALIEDLRATRLAIPALGIDAAIQGSQEIPDTGAVPAGCPAKPPGRTTLTVPNEGIATPDEAFEGLENKAWIYGHSRWQGVPGLFFALEDIEVGDELFVDGVDRQTGAPVAGRRYVVEALYLTDTESGGELVTAGSAEDVPTSPTVLLQTSVRERGAGQAWILSREKLAAKAETLVEGDLDDPCKYLLLFVIARAA